MVELRTGIIGFGNCGSNIARLAHDQLGIDAIAINTSSDDLSFHKGKIPTILIGDGGGVGKDRSAAKYFLRCGINNIVSSTEVSTMLSKCDVIFIASSCGGGSGSGSSLLLTQALMAIVDDTEEDPIAEKFIIPIGVAPVSTEALGSQLNFTDYMKDLMSSLEYINSYMLYDNDRCESIDNQDTVIKNVNQRVVDDIKVLIGKHIQKSNGRSIDTQSMKTILRARGRILVARAIGFKGGNISTSKDIEGMLIRDIQTSPHMMVDRGSVQEFGLIANINDTIYDIFNINIPSIGEFLGRPTDSFENVVQHNTPDAINEVYLIASGLPFPNEKLVETNQLLRKINEEERARQEKLEKMKHDLGSLFQDDTLSNIRSNRSRYQNNLNTKKTNKKTKLSFDDIFGEK